MLEAERAAFEAWFGAADASRVLLREDLDLEAFVATWGPERAQALFDVLVELFGEELDDFTANDSLENYRREYSGESSTWIGRHQPTDEGTEDPENMVDWRVCYDIEKV